MIESRRKIPGRAGFYSAIGGEDALNGDFGDTGMAGSPLPVFDAVSSPVPDTGNFISKSACVFLAEACHMKLIDSID